MFGTSFLSRLNVRLRIPFKYHSEERSDERIYSFAAMRETHICHLERNGQIFHFSDDGRKISRLWLEMTVTPVSVWGTVAEATDHSLCSG